MGAASGSGRAAGWAERDQRCTRKLSSSGHSPWSAALKSLATGGVDGGTGACAAAPRRLRREIASRGRRAERIERAGSGRPRPASCQGSCQSSSSSSSHSTFSPTQRPLEAISRRSRRGAAAQAPAPPSTPPVAQEFNADPGEWPEDDSFRVQRWSRSAQPAARPEPEAATNPAGSRRALPRSSRRRID